MMRLSLSKIKAEIMDPKTEVVSFDVFDTLVVRPFWEPSDLFLLLNREAAQLFVTSVAVDFSSCRKEAEELCRREARNSGREDVTLEEIYRYIVRTGIYPEKTVWKIMDKEKELELRFCRSRKSAVEILQFALKQGKRIAAISDMYLPSAFISEIFQRNEIPMPERIFVSCEAGLTKESGHLFEYALKEMGIGAQALVHIGDNPRSDVKTATKLGIRAIPYPRPAALLKGKDFSRSGYTFRRAYMGIASSTAGYNADKNLGVRCMLAVAANRLYDDPYRPEGSRKNSYAGNLELFGTEALGMYCMAHTLWIDQVRKKADNDCILFFSRDG